MTSYESMFPKTQVCFLCFLPLSSLEEVGHVLPLSHAGVCGVWGWTGGMPRALHLTAVAPNPMRHGPTLKAPSILGMPIKVERLLPKKD